MKKIQKTIYIAEDGAEFELQADCELHEEFLYIAKMIEADVNYNPDNLQGTPYEIAVIFRGILDKVLKKRVEDKLVKYDG